MEPINIMTSCDENYAKFIMPQLVSIQKNSYGRQFNFYLFHYRVTPETVGLLTTFCADNCPNITFYEVVVKQDDIKSYLRIGEFGNSARWPIEAYFWMRPQDYLPADAQRVVYMDAADVIFDGDISPYYFDDFEEKSLLAPQIWLRTKGVNEPRPYVPEDLEYLIKESEGAICSGFFVMNLEKLRRLNYTLADYEFLVKKIVELRSHFHGDQPVLSAAFAGDIKHYGYPEETDRFYAPYHFDTSNWFQKPGLSVSYKPVVYHYAMQAKPWIIKFTDEYVQSMTSLPIWDRSQRHLSSYAPLMWGITQQHAKSCELWWEACKETPIYNECLTAAKQSTHLFLTYYLDTYNRYNKLNRLWS